MLADMGAVITAVLVAGEIATSCGREPAGKGTVVTRVVCQLEQGHRSGLHVRHHSEVPIRGDSGRTESNGNGRKYHTGIGIDHTDRAARTVGDKQI